LTKELTAEAAKNGDLAAFKWLIGNGCKIGYMSFQLAAQYGHINILEFLHQIDSPWSFEAFELAVINNHLRILKWGFHYGYIKYADNLYDIAVEHDLTDISRWLKLKFK